MLILAYHHVFNADQDLCIKPGDFEKQLLTLRRKGFKSMSLESYLQTLKVSSKFSTKGKYVIITFDDGWQDNYMNAFPILQKYGYTATIFLAVAYIGEKEDYLTWEQVMKMHRAGFEFGSHTLTHPHLTRIPIAKAREEITESKKALEIRLGKEIKTFCYPYGEYNQSIIQLVREAGYQGAVVTPSSGRCETSIYSIRRVGVYATDTLFSFRIKTSPLVNIISSSSMLWKVAKRVKRLVGI